MKVKISDLISRIDIPENYSNPEWRLDTTNVPFSIIVNGTRYTFCDSGKSITAPNNKNAIALCSSLLEMVGLLPSYKAMCARRVKERMDLIQQSDVLQELLSSLTEEEKASCSEVFTKKLHNISERYTCLSKSIEHYWVVIEVIEIISRDL